MDFPHRFWLCLELYLLMISLITVIWIENLILNNPKQRYQKPFVISLDWNPKLELVLILKSKVS